MSTADPKPAPAPPAPRLSARPGAPDPSTLHPPEDVRPAREVPEEAPAPRDDRRPGAVRVGCQVLRTVGETAFPPVSKDGGATWLLPFAPPDGAELRIHPGAEVVVRTGLRLYLPPGKVGVILRPFSARPGLMAPVLEVDSRCEEEIAVPVKNYGNTPIVFAPGSYVLTLRVRSSDAAEVVVDRAASPL